MILRTLRRGASFLSAVAFSQASAAMVRGLPIVVAQII
jgi:hypothetical protein